MPPDPPSGGLLKHSPPSRSQCKFLQFPPQISKSCMNTCIPSTQHCPMSTWDYLGHPECPKCTWYYLGHPWTSQLKSSYSREQKKRWRMYCSVLCVMLLRCGCSTVMFLLRYSSGTVLWTWKFSTSLVEGSVQFGFRLELVLWKLVTAFARKLCNVNLTRRIPRSYYVYTYILYRFTCAFCWNWVKTECRDVATYSIT